VLVERDRLEVMHAKLLTLPPEEHYGIDIKQALGLRLGAGEAAARDSAIRGEIEDQLLAYLDPDDDDPPNLLMAWSDLATSLEQEDADEAARARLSDLGLEPSQLRQIMARKVVNQARIAAIRQFREVLVNPNAACGAMPLPSYNPASAPAATTGQAAMPHTAAPAVSASPWATLTATEAVEKFFEHNPRPGGKDGKARKGGSA
jgi:hypothetical protein